MPALLPEQGELKPKTEARDREGERESERYVYVYICIYLYASFVKGLGFGAYTYKSQGLEILQIGGFLLVHHL